MSTPSSVLHEAEEVAELAEDLHEVRVKLRARLLKMVAEWPDETLAILGEHVRSAHALAKQGD